MSLILIAFFLGSFLLVTLWVVFFPGRKDYEHMIRSSSLQQITNVDLGGARGGFCWN